MEAFIVYLIGWIIFSIGYFIYAYKYDKQNIKLSIYHAFIYGVYSWLGIIFCFCMLMTCLIFSLHEWIENKLSQ